MSQLLLCPGCWKQLNAVWLTRLGELIGKVHVWENRPTVDANCKPIVKIVKKSGRAGEM